MYYASIMLYACSDDPTIFPICYLLFVYTFNCFCSGIYMKIFICVLRILYAYSFSFYVSGFIPPFHPSIPFIFEFVVTRTQSLRSSLVQKLPSFSL